MSDLSHGFYAERMGYARLHCACGHAGDPRYFHSEDQCVWIEDSPKEVYPRLMWDDWYREHTMRVTLLVEAAQKGRGVADALRQLAEWTEKVRERF